MQLMLKLLAAVAVVGILVVAGLGFFAGRAVFAARDAQSTANAALQSAGKHTLDYDNGLRIAVNAPAPSTGSTSGTDYAKMKQASDSIVAKVDQVRMGIRSDQSRLVAAGEQLQAAGRNPLVAPLRSGLDRSQRRVEYVRSALDAADTALGFERDAVQATSAMADVMTDYVALADKERTGDFAAGLAIFGTLDPKVQTALQSVARPHLPPHEVTFIRGLATLVADEKVLLQSAQAGDANGVNAALATFETDSGAVLNIDTDQIDSEETAILQPYRDRYESGMKAAGFSPVSSTTA